MTQKEYILKLYKSNKDTIFVGSLGTISKDLKEIDDGTNHIVTIKGAMGGAMGVALGIAISQPKKVICLIGDGSFLMKMGSMSTILAENPKNLRVLILNNNKYASTGGHITNFETVKDYIPAKFTIVNETGS